MEVNTNITVGHYFKTPLFTGVEKSFLADLIKATDPHIEEARKRKKDLFGMSHHSNVLYNDKKFDEFIKYISMISTDFMEMQGYKTEIYKPTLNELWVQEFTKKGGGHHGTHTHYNQHVSGFYFLKCSEDTSFPIFHDPRAGSLMCRLEERKPLEVTDSSPFIHCKVEPGSIIIFPGYLPHEFSLDSGKDSFRFIHWNFQFLPKEYKDCEGN
jgi:uncharacterized protein (TIGR02466 family)|tara:strand:- start:107 stop:742 length:636 start_codon:yes stop_codon:yes gene_type:complete